VGGFMGRAFMPTMSACKMYRTSQVVLLAIILLLFLVVVAAG
jgi:hypothetical protein